MAQHAAFLAALALALVLSDMLCGIFKHSGSPETPLGPIFSPLAPDVLRPSKDSDFRPAPLRLAACRASPHRTARTRSRSEPSPGNTAPYPPRRDDRGSRQMSAAVIRRRWFTWLGIAAALLICYSRIYLAKTLPRRSVARHRRKAS